MGSTILQLSLSIVLMFFVIQNGNELGWYTSGLCFNYVSLLSALVFCIDCFKCVSMNGQNRGTVDFL